MNRTEGTTELKLQKKFNSKKEASVDEREGGDKRYYLVILASHQLTDGWYASIQKIL